jgi:hypothetical protein
MYDEFFDAYHKEYGDALLQANDLFKCHRIRGKMEALFDLAPSEIKRETIDALFTPLCADYVSDPYIDLDNLLLTFNIHIYDGFSRFALELRFDEAKNSWRIYNAMRLVDGHEVIPDIGDLKHLETYFPANHPVFVFLGEKKKREMDVRLSYFDTTPLSKVIYENKCVHFLFQGSELIYEYCYVKECLRYLRYSNGSGIYSRDSFLFFAQMKSTIIDRISSHPNVRLHLLLS